MKRARFSGRHVAIAFALGLAGAIAACGGDDSVTPEETGGAGGMSQDGGKGGSGGDASPDRGPDTKVDSPGSGGSGGSGGADASADRGGGGTGGTGGTDASVDGSGGGGGVDASPDVSTQPDAPRETTVDSTVTDQSVEARGPDAGPDGNDGAVTPTPDTGPDVVADVTPDRAPDVVTPPVDANDAAVASDGNDGGPVSFLPSQVTTGWVGNDNPITTNDAGQLTWTASYPEAGATVELSGSYATAQNWTGFTTLAITVNIVSGAASMGTVQAFVHSTGGGNAFSGEENGVGVIDGSDNQVANGEHTFFLDLTGGTLLLNTITDIEIDITPIAGTPPNTVIEVIGFELSSP